MRIYIVQKGDSLDKIAKKHHVQIEDIMHLNSHISNAEYIVPGMKIKLPNQTAQTIQKQETKEKGNEQKYSQARSHERPFGSVASMNDRGMSKKRKGLQLNKDQQQSIFSKDTKQAEIKKQKAKPFRKEKKPLKTYAQNQYRYDKLDHSFEASHHKTNESPRIERIKKESFEEKYTNRPMPPTFNQPEQYTNYHDSIHYHQPFCPCCMYHWRMQQSMMIPMREQHPLQQEAPFNEREDRSQQQGKRRYY